MRLPFSPPVTPQKVVSEDKINYRILRLFADDFQMDDTGLKKQVYWQLNGILETIQRKVEIPTTSLLGTNENIRLIVCFSLEQKIQWKIKKEQL